MTCSTCIQLTHCVSCSISLFYCPSRNQRRLDHEETNQCSTLPLVNCDQPVCHQYLSSSCLTVNRPLLTLASVGRDREERLKGKMEIEKEERLQHTCRIITKSNWSHKKFNTRTIKQ